MWVRLWAKAHCPSGHESEVSTYEWYEADQPDDILESDSQEYHASTWVRESERSSYGFERVGNVLPDKVRTDLERNCRRQIENAVMRLRIIMGSVDPPTRFDRESIK